MADTMHGNGANGGPNVAYGDHHGHHDYADDRTRYENSHHSGGNVPISKLPPQHQGTISQVYNPDFFKVANPGPLGLISFAITTFCLGLYQCGVGLPDANPLGNVGPYQAIFGLAVFYGGTAQFIAGIMEFRVGNTFGCTVHCSYGAFWLAFAMFIYPTVAIQDAYAGDARAFSVHVGIFLIAWAMLTLIFFIGALKTNIAILFVFFTLFLAFLFLACAEFTRATHPTTALRLNRAGGVFTVITALAALYAGAAGLMLEDTTWVRFPLGELNYDAPRVRSRGSKHEKSKV